MDRRVFEIKNVVKVCNLSSRFDNDCLYYETLTDEDGRGTSFYLSEILCFEVRL